MRGISAWLAAPLLVAAGWAASGPLASATPRVTPLPASLDETSPAAGPSVEHAYGADPAQRLDIWPGTTAQPAPLILFVHGGGWSRGDKRTATAPQMVRHFQNAGYAVASMNYRLVPAATVEQQAADVAAALAWLRQHARGLGIVATRPVLMGHSAGAHLVALVGTDPQYLAAAGMSPSDLRGVIALDGGGFDVARQAAGAGPALREVYAAAFGSMPARQQALSPIFHAGAPDAPAFLLVHVDRPDSRAQAQAFAAALAQAGTPAEVQGVDGRGLRGHMEMNRTLGSADAPTTGIVDAWLHALPR